MRRGIGFDRRIDAGAAQLFLFDHLHPRAALGRDRDRQCAAAVRPSSSGRPRRRQPANWSSRATAAGSPADRLRRRIVPREDRRQKRIGRLRGRRIARARFRGGRARRRSRAARARSAVSPAVVCSIRKYAPLMGVSATRAPPTSRASGICAAIDLGNVDVARAQSKERRLRRGDQREDDAPQLRSRPIVRVAHRARCGRRAATRPRLNGPVPKGRSFHAALRHVRRSKRVRRQDSEREIGLSEQLGHGGVPRLPQTDRHRIAARASAARPRGDTRLAIPPGCADRGSREM